MANNDKGKEYLRSMYKYDLYADKMPSKSIRKFKRKDRQAAVKQIEKELIDHGKSQKKEK